MPKIYKPQNELGNNLVDITKIGYNDGNEFEEGFTTIENKIQLEEERATAEEEKLQQAIDAEKTRATEAETQLQTNIDNEADRAIAAENNLDNKITAETERATAAESGLNDKITAEETRATSAESALNDKITAEINRATEAENNLQEKINEEETRATSAESALSIKDTELEQAIATEVSRAQGVESGFNTRITTLESDSYEFNSHINNNAKHLSNFEHQNLTRLIAQFPQVTPDIPVVPGTMPDTALDYSVITSYISMQAQPGVSTAPGNIFGARVPWARQENGVWVNNDSNVNYSVFGAAQKLWDNLGLQNEPSTDKIEGVDDYIGKKWVFFWNRCNYITDNYGNKWVSAIEGYDTSSYGGTTFSVDKNVGIMGPKFWYCVKTEKYQDPETNNWLTVDGTENGTPLYQLWVIGDRSWSELPSDRQEELIKHGITESDWHLWPGCKVYDAADDALKERPYYVHAAYAGGYEVSKLGIESIVSKPNKPLRNNLSHNSLANLYGTTVLGGAECYVNTFGMLFDIIKNADKNSQNRYTGNASNQLDTVLSTHSTKQADYVFPISSTGSFKVGCTVYICDTYYSNITSMPNSYIKRSGLQYGRILAIENRNIVTSDGESVNTLCLVLDPTTIDPFVVCTGDSNTSAQEAAKAISETGQNACAFATHGFSLSGETDTVIGKHDGALNLADNAHSFRVQGTEYQPGTWILAADTIACKGDGATIVNINGTEHTPDSTQYVYLICPKGLTGRAQSGNLSSIIEDGYKPVAIGSCVSGGYILNVEVDGETGLAYPVSFGGTGSGSNYGHGDNFYVGGNPAEFLVGGALDDGRSRRLRRRERHQRAVGLVLALWGSRLISRGF